MTTLIKQQTRAYTQIISLLCLLSVFTIGGCLSLLLLRQKIENSAKVTLSMEREIEREERRIRFLDTKLAEIHQPSYLQREIKRLGLTLQPARPNQIIYLEERHTPSEDFQMASDRLIDREEPFRRTFDLAVMEPLKNIN